MTAGFLLAAWHGWAASSMRDALMHCVTSTRIASRRSAAWWIRWIMPRLHGREFAPGGRKARGGSCVKRAAGLGRPALASNVWQQPIFDALRPGRQGKRIRLVIFRLNNA